MSLPQTIWFHNKKGNAAATRAEWIPPAPFIEETTVLFSRFFRLAALATSREPEWLRGRGRESGEFAASLLQNRLNVGSE
jgi:hypothetical protein